jgi:hypothetical protein
VAGGTRTRRSGPLERSTEELLDTEIAEFFEALTAAE